MITCRYGVAFWYAGRLVRDADEDYTAGRVMNVIFGTMIAGVSLGQAAPNFGAFASGAMPTLSVVRVLVRLDFLRLVLSWVQGALPDTVCAK